MISARYVYNIVLLAKNRHNKKKLKDFESNSKNSIFDALGHSSSYTFTTGLYKNQKCCLLIIVSAHIDVQ